MSSLSDIEITQQYEAKDTRDIARTAGIDEKYLKMYRCNKAKVDYKPLGDLANKPNSKLILVTAINPAPAGEGKTTISVGLIDGLCHIDKEAIVALRKPSLGPVFGIKGGAAGGGYAQVVPMEGINLHFTGDFHAIGVANNLLATLLDNHIYQGNELRIDPERITWKRVVDMNGCQLRSIVDGLGPRTNNVTREDSYDITVASEIMAVLCLSSSTSNMKERLGKMIIDYTYNKEPVTAARLRTGGAMCALLKGAIKPNLVQTLKGIPAFIYDGPFVDIAHGYDPPIATRMAFRLNDYAVTKAGFGAGLDAEEFLDTECCMAGIAPSATVIIATARVFKHRSGVAKPDLNNEDLGALEEGMPNLLHRVENVTKVYGLPCVVIINRFPTDTEAELTLIRDKCKELGVEVAPSEVWAKGSAGAVELAEEVVRLCEAPNNFSYVYDAELSIKEKLNATIQRVYHGSRAVLTNPAVKQAQQLGQLSFGSLPICMAETQYSFTDDAKSLGAPEDFEIAVKSLKVSAGAGFIVALTGDVMTMPGLPKKPSSENIDVDENGHISGLF